MSEPSLRDTACGRRIQAGHNVSTTCVRPAGHAGECSPSEPSLCPCEWDEMGMVRRVHPGCRIHDGDCQGCGGAGCAACDARALLPESEAGGDQC